MSDDASGDRWDDRDESRPTTPSDGGRPDATDRDDDWDRIPIDLSSDEEPTDAASDEEDDPHAPEPNSAPIEAGDPTLEHALFVFLGAVLMVAVLLRVIALPF